MVSGEDKPHAPIEASLARILSSRLALAIVTLAIVGLLALANFPWWANRYSINVKTQYIEISATAQREHLINAKLHANSEIRVLGARQTDDLPPELEPLRDSITDVRLRSSGAVLRKITLQPGAGLSIRATPDSGMDVGLLNAASITLSLSGEIKCITSSGQTVIIHSQHAINWDIRAENENTFSRILIKQNSFAFSIYDQPIDLLYFRQLERLRPGDARPLESEITSGELKLLDIGTKIDLEPHELTSFEGGRKALSRLDVGNAGIMAEVDGEAKHISIGPPRSEGSPRLEHDLTPSLLAYILVQHEVKLLWTSAIVVIGFLWKARKWALAWKNG